MSGRPPLGAASVRAATSLLALSFAIPFAVQAQDSTDETDEPEGNVIIVTAQKRDQNILDVPVAISAIGQDTLQAAQVDRFTELTAVSPSLTITTSGNRNQNPIFLRGIGTFSFSTAAEPAVLVMIDDVPLLLPGQAIGNALEGFFSTNIVYRSETLLSNRDPARFTFPAGETVNVRLGIRHPDGNWTASIFARNLTQDRQPIGFLPLGFAGQDDLGLRAWPVAGLTTRVVGASLGFNF